MWAARIESQRELLLGQGWVIARLFSGKKTSKSEEQSFIRYGAAASGAAEPFNPKVHEAAAKILRGEK